MTAARLTLVVLFSAALASNMARAEPSAYPTGVTRYDPAKAYGTFILFSGGDNKTRLVDMDGREVHRWNYPGFPSGILDPALTGGKRGHVMVELSMMKKDDPAMFKGLPLVYHDKSLAELDWNGKVVWQWGPTRRAARCSNTTTGRGSRTGIRWCCRWWCIPCRDSRCRSWWTKRSTK
jgi:hypothetical protein